VTKHEDGAGHLAGGNPPQLALLVQGLDRRGLMRDMTAAIAAHDGDIWSVEILERGERSRVFWEIDAVLDEQALEAALLEIDGVDSVQRMPTMYEVYGKRIIVVGGRRAGRTGRDRRRRRGRPPQHPGGEDQRRHDPDRR
jgi:hypothetical protein